MLWLVWRQHRLPVLITFLLLLAFGTVLLIHGLRTADLAAGLAPGSDELARLFGEQFNGLYLFINWLPLVPGLVGLFLGAPMLTREFEAGTAKLAWTQSVSRHRWLVTKLVVLGGVVTLGGLALGTMINAWLATFRETGDGYRFQLLPLFGGSGVAAGAWWLFAFVLGVAAGLALRRTLPAMAVAFAGYLVAFVVIASPLVDFRDMYAEPVQVVQTGATDILPDGSWRLDSQWLDGAGQATTADAYVLALDAGCADEGVRFDYSPCLFEHGYQLAVDYYPPSMYWRFQWTETAILVAAAVAIGGGVAWSARRRGVR
ncbi:hypothetical protein [Actinophytocola sediminis]